MFNPSLCGSNLISDIVSNISYPLFFTNSITKNSKLKKFLYSYFLSNSYKVIFRDSIKRLIV